MRANEPRTHTFEEVVIPFMLAFFPLALVLGVVDHFFLPEYDLRLPSLALAGAAGWVSVWLRRRRAERLRLLGGGNDPGSTFEFEAWMGRSPGR